MPLDLDAFIQKHLHASQSKSKNRLKYDTEDLYGLIKMSMETFQNEGSLVRMNPPCVIVGDIHGQFYDLLRMFSLGKDKDKNEQPAALSQKYVFIGDYVDRGTQSLECVSLVFALKNKFPTKYQVLRGNHETVLVNKEYGFSKELEERFGLEEGGNLYNKFNEVFSWMPLAALVGSKILCMHGGISPLLGTLEDIEKIERPIVEVNESPLARDLLWSDPVMDIKGFPPNETRGVSCYFGEAEVIQVCKNLNIDLIVRGHQMMLSGWGSFANRKMFTIFTAPRYPKENETDPPNAGAVMFVNYKGCVGIKVLNPNGENAGRSGCAEKTSSTNSKNSSISTGKPSSGVAGKQKKKKK